MSGPKAEPNVPLRLNPGIGKIGNNFVSQKRVSIPSHKLPQLCFLVLGVSNVLVDRLTSGVMRCIPSANLIIRDLNQVMCVRTLTI